MKRADLHTMIDLMPDRMLTTAAGALRGALDETYKASEVLDLLAKKDGNTKPPETFDGPTDRGEQEVAISTKLMDMDSASMQWLTTELRWPPNVIRATLRRLQRQGKVETVGKGRGTGYRWKGEVASDG